MREKLFSLPYRNHSFFLRWFLSLVAVKYRAVVALANIFAPLKQFFPKPVISVGSVIAGGSGKTTFTAFLATQLELPVALLSHGYRGKKQGRVEGIEYGDEAFLLQKMVPFAKVFAGKDRVASAKLALQEEVDYFLLDSGMQVTNIHKDIEIAVVHYDNLEKHWHYLPRGLLRETPYRLEKCQAIVIHGVSTEKEFTQAQQFLRRYSKVPVVGTNSFITNKEAVAGKKVAVFTGIGHPERFYQMIEEAGGEILVKKTLADHDSLADVTEFVKQCKGAEVIVCTEKDFVKLPKKEGIVSLQIEMKVLFGKQAFTSLLNTIKMLIMDRYE